MKRGTQGPKRENSPSRVGFRNRSASPIDIATVQDCGSTRPGWKTRYEAKEANTSSINTSDETDEDLNLGIRMMIA
jgi:hypothetical protein